MKSTRVLPQLSTLRSPRVLRNMAKAGIVSTVLSVAITVIALNFISDRNSLPAEDARSVLRTGLLLSAFIPATIAPIVAWFFQSIIYTLEETQAQLVRAAQTDFLTGLLNRHGFYTSAGEIIDTAREAGHPVAALILDVDHFKAINDTHGHDCGDTAICHIAGRIRDRIADGAAARIGGEEFAVLMPVASKPVYERIAETVIAEVRGLAIPHERNADWGVVTTSVGGAFIDAADDELMHVFRTADERLYAAKEAGRNQVAI